MYVDFYHFLLTYFLIENPNALVCDFNRLKDLIAEKTLAQNSGLKTTDITDTLKDIPFGIITLKKVPDGHCDRRSARAMVSHS